MDLTSLLTGSGAVIGAGVLGVVVKFAINRYHKRMPREATIQWAYKKWNKLKNVAVLYDIPLINSDVEESLEEAIFTTFGDIGLARFCAMHDLDPRKVTSVIWRNSCMWDSVEDKKKYLNS